MDDDDPAWAIVSVRIISPSHSVAQISELLGRESTALSDEQWAVDLIDDREMRLDDQIRIVKGWLAERAEILRGLTDADISLHMGWTPRIPQDGIILDQELIALLQSVRGYILLDTYLG